MNQILLKISIFVFIILPILVNGQCQFGCMQCDANNICQMCNKGYNLDLTLNTCINQSCPQGLFYQEDLSNPQNEGTCLTLCDRDSFSNIQQRQCIQLEQCSISYLSEQYYTSGDTVLEIFSYKQDYLLFIYKDTIVQTTRENGEYEQSLAISQDIISLQMFGDAIIVVKFNYNVYEWDLIENKFNFISTIANMSSSTPNLSVQLISLNNYLIISIAQSQQTIQLQILFNQINLQLVESKSIEIDYMGASVSIQNNLIIYFQQAGVRIDLIELDHNNSLIITYFTSQQYICQTQSMLNFKAIAYGMNANAYILLFDSKTIQSVSIKNCQQQDFEDIPNNIISFSLLNLDQFVVTFPTSFCIIDINLNIIKSVDFLPLQLLDLLSINNAQSLLFLLSDSTIKQFSISPVNGQIALLEDEKNVQIKIDQAQQLFYLCSNELKGNNQRLLIRGSGIQSTLLQQQLDQSSEKSEYIVADYEFSYDYNQNSIVSTQINESLNIVTVCSKDGIYQWNIAHVYKSQYLNHYKIQNDSCLHLEYVNDNSILVLLTSRIIILDLFTFDIIQSWNVIVPISTFIPKIASSGNYNILIFNKSIFLYDFHQLNPMKFSDYSDTITYISLQKNDILLLQYSYSISTFQINPQSKTISKLNTFNSNSMIIKTKIKNYPIELQQQNSIQFEILSYLQNRSFLVMNEQLVQIFLFDNIPLQSLIDFNFIANDLNDDSYLILGKSIKLYTSYSVECYFVQKVSTIYYLAYALASALQILEVNKMIDYFNQLYYSSRILYNQSTFSLITSIIYYPSSHLNFYQEFIYMYQNIGVRAYKTNKGNNVIITDGYGFVGTKIRQLQPYEIYYSFDNSNSNIMIQVQQSLPLNRLFIVKELTIMVFNIHTDIFEEEIMFNNNMDGNITQFSILELDSVILACKSNVLLLKNYIDNKVITFETAFISGFVVVDNNIERIIILYGMSIQILKLDLTISNQRVYSKVNEQYSNCLATQTKLICKLYNKTSVIILDLNQLTLQNTILPKTSDINLKLSIDQDNQNIFLYSNQIEAYSLIGQFIGIVQNISGAITEFIYCSNNIVLLSSSQQSCNNSYFIFQLLYYFT